MWQASTAAYCKAQTFSLGVYPEAKSFQKNLKHLSTSEDLRCVCCSCWTGYDESEKLFSSLQGGPGCEYCRITREDIKDALGVSAIGPFGSKSDSAEQHKSGGGATGRRGLLLTLTWLADAYLFALHLCVLTQVDRANANTCQNVEGATSVRTTATTERRKEVNKDPTANPAFTTSVFSLAMKQEVGFLGKIWKKSKKQIQNISSSGAAFSTVA